MLQAFGTETPASMAANDQMPSVSKKEKKRDFGYVDGMFARTLGTGMETVVTCITVYGKVMKKRHGVPSHDSQHRLLCVNT